MQALQTAFQENAMGIKNQSFNVCVMFMVLAYMVSLVVTGKIATNVKDKAAAKGWYGMAISAFIIGLIAIVLSMYVYVKHREILDDITASTLGKVTVGFIVLACIMFFIGNAMIINAVNNNKINHPDDLALYKDMKGITIMTLVFWCITIVSLIVYVFARRSVGSDTNTQFYYCY